MNISLKKDFGFTLIEGLIAMSLALLLLSGIWYVFGSSTRQASSGSEMQEKFHRLRIVSEILKDDLREGYEILEPKANETSNQLIFKKFGSLESSDSESLRPILKIVNYTFSKEEKMLLGTYGKSEIELIRTNLFENVEFERLELFGREFIRMYFTLKKENTESNKEMKIIYTVAPRALTTRVAQKGWYNLNAALAIEE